MKIQSLEDVGTSTMFGKLSTNEYFEDDEMYAYIEITEWLIETAPKPRISVNRRPSLSSNPNKTPTLPMRKSLFAHVPPFIIFRDDPQQSDKLPTVITRHLLWWRAKQRFPCAVSSTIAKSGFRTTTKRASNWCGTWCSSQHASSQLQRTRIFSKVNLFPNNNQFGDKILLWRNFQRMKIKHGVKNFDFMPMTFVLPEEKNELKRYVQQNGGIWILKPPCSCAGSGIKIVSRFQQVPDGRSLIAQRYISKPKLINDYKFDIRMYVLLTSVDPLKIYVYPDGLVKLATVKYVNHVSTLSNKFMHLTNTSVNKYSPNFVPNDDPTECKGNMWSLSCLWKYLSSEDVDPVDIWTKIKDIAIKTVISTEGFLVNAWKKNSKSSYNYYQLFGFDILLDQKYHPWLLEVNTFPSMKPDTPLCRIVKCQLAKDYLNLVGFHVPNVLTGKELNILRTSYKENTVCYNHQLYTNTQTWADRKKQYTFSKMTRSRYLKTILKNLTPGDVRVLIRHEDEIARTGHFEMIFPTRNTHRYLRFFGEVRYYNMLMDAWENAHGRDRLKGIERLKQLCIKKYHLTYGM
ncbi:tubulin monoglutamylase TTLL4 [Lasioglossum baleicum]|uniref:tubulin monoglutamylase TTLL4 n=1 Tax=Lasioglossum baleicum TaxID=434251 RepID=UPI003FCC6EC5